MDFIILLLSSFYSYSPDIENTYQYNICPTTYNFSCPTILPSRSHEKLFVQIIKYELNVFPNVVIHWNFFHSFFLFFYFLLFFFLFSTSLFFWWWCLVILISNQVSSGSLHVWWKKRTLCICIYINLISGRMKVWLYIFPFSKAHTLWYLLWITY